MKHIKRYITTLTAMLLIVSLSIGQTTQNISEIISDVLSQLPAQTQTEYNKLMAKLTATGEEGLLSLIGQLNPPGNQSNEKLDYAISGWTNFVANDDAKRKEALSAFAKALDTPLHDTNEAMIIRQMGLIGNALSTNDPAKALASASMKEANKQLKSALKNNDTKLLNNLLSEYNFHNDAKATTRIIKSLNPKSSPTVQIAILSWLGQQKITKTTPLIYGYLKSSNRDIQKAAAFSLVRMGTEEALQPLAEMLKSNDESTIQLGKEALSSYNGDISDALSSVFDESTDNGKIAALQLISNRKMESQYKLVYNQMSGDNEAIKREAAITLKDVSTENNLDDLFNLLEQTDTEYTSPVQFAINGLLSPMEPNDQLKTIAERMMRTNKEHLYFPALANSQTPQGVGALINVYNSDKGTNKKAAFDALKQLKTFEGIHPMLDIARNSKDKETTSEAVNVIIQKIASSDQTGAVRYLYLREAMEFANTDSQKNNILRLIGSTNQYQALLFVAPYMDNPALRESAAQAAMNIATNNPQFAGAETTNILNKVSKTVNNPDAEYQRQSITKYLSENSNEGGFVSIFNGKNLDGWKGLVENPLKRAKMSEKELAAAQIKADKQMALDWKVEDGLIIFDGKGYDNLCTDKQYGDFEMIVDWKLYPGPEPDAGIYLRGTPQVQIWDIARTNVGAEVGSGGLYNNTTNPSKPLKVADQKVGEWNTFRIKMVGDRVWVWLNDELVTDNVVLENYWDRNQPIFPVEQIELQAHGSKVAYRDIFIKEL